MPSLVPSTAEDLYIVLNSYGRHGVAFAETDINRADYETTVDDLLTGQHSDPLRVIRFNPDTDSCEDVSHMIATELLRRVGLKGDEIPSVLEGFIDRHAGPARQLTLRLHT